MLASDITLPLWLFVPIGLLAVAALFRGLLLPVIGRIYRRRTSVNAHLLADKFNQQNSTVKNRRGIWIDNLLSDPEVIRAIEVEAKNSGKSVARLHQTAEKFADELMPSFNVPLYFRLGYWLARGFLRFFYWHKVAYAEPQHYDTIDGNSCIIIVSNHRSHFDPFLLIYLASRRAAISYSAGEWAKNFPIRQFMQAIGFYVTRHNSDNALYLKILERYIFLAVGHCIPQGLFIDETLLIKGEPSPDDATPPLKLNMLNYVVKSMNQGQCQDIIFIPAALNYDKIPEDKSRFIHQAEDHKSKGSFYSLLSTLKYIALLLPHCLPHKHKPFGYAAVNYGEPISLQQWQRDNKVDFNNCTQLQGQAAINRLGQEIAEEISSQLPILPVSILALIFLELGDQIISELDIKVKASQLLFKLRDQGRHMPIPQGDEDLALQQGLYTMQKYKLIQKLDNGLYQADMVQGGLFKFYAEPIGNI